MVCWHCRNNVVPTGSRQKKQRFPAQGKASEETDCTVLISGFVALTLSPMMCGRLLVPHSSEDEKDKPLGFFQKIAHLLDRAIFLLEEKYRSSLSNLLNHNLSKSCFECDYHSNSKQS